VIDLVDKLAVALLHVLAVENFLHLAPGFGFLDGLGRAGNCFEDVL
jgi:hypothetical protein